MDTNTSAASQGVEVSTESSTEDGDTSTRARRNTKTTTTSQGAEVSTQSSTEDGDTSTRASMNTKTITTSQGAEVSSESCTEDGDTSTRARMNTNTTTTSQGAEVSTESSTEDGDTSTRARMNTNTSNTSQGAEVSTQSSTEDGDTSTRARATEHMGEHMGDTSTRTRMDTNTSTTSQGVTEHLSEHMGEHMGDTSTRTRMDTNTSTTSQGATKHMGDTSTRTCMFTNTSTTSQAPMGKPIPMAPSSVPKSIGMDFDVSHRTILPDCTADDELSLAACPFCLMGSKNGEEGSGSSGACYYCQHGPMDIITHVNRLEFANLQHTNEELEHQETIRDLNNVVVISEHRGAMRLDMDIEEPSVGGRNGGQNGGVPQYFPGDEKEDGHVRQDNVQGAADEEWLALYNKNPKLIERRIHVTVKFNFGNNTKSFKDRDFRGYKDDEFRGHPRYPKVRTGYT
ncbi:hypothetical protein SARC_00805 [Sphaeroforma arctica JP610]|uniref:Uncharacterized protein n=1 Tax=Sphaeroforma arctica JP610 TaxID=667725 RepID=A0A0L0GDW9_9EUKA|nr:hypothetical protein SARC_00805 [Sphaeroforma arctica JP610]KNC87061.1 hypothetical protein SARC_00805 [Sphaeroforma arctica JP610]|eukprot:XP_014160963.1 hypothetical protein SARC_00805 [Sphaeroforma arctica JP610]